MTEPIYYRGGPLDGQVVKNPASGEPMTEDDVMPHTIHQPEWVKHYEWNATDKAYVWSLMSRRDFEVYEAFRKVNEQEQS